MTENTFKKSERLRKRSEFLALSKYGKKLSNAYFILLFSPGQTPNTRLGITASRKVGHAVARNRIKRLSREYFRQNRKHFRHPWDINLIVKQKAAGSPADQIFLALKEIFDRIPNSFE